LGGKTVHRIASPTTPDSKTYVSENKRTLVEPVTAAEPGPLAAILSGGLSDGRRGTFWGWQVDGHGCAGTKRALNFQHTPVQLDQCLGER